MVSLVLGVAGRLTGRHIPRPEQVGFKDADRIAREIAHIRDKFGSCLFVTFVSSALRVCLEAKRLGIDMAGVTVLAGGEPPTPSKVSSITACGARWLPGYWCTEAGAVGKGCASPSDESDVHLYKDMFGLIQHPRKAPGCGMIVDAFLFTSLLSSSPKVMINVEMDDYGIVEERSCGCPLHDMGYHTHLRQIRSFSKLCSEGMCLLPSDVLRLLEEELPASFGGTCNDYQLVEEEDDRGFTRLVLHIDPEVQIPDEETVSETLSRFLRQHSLVGAMTSSIWDQAGTIVVSRQSPRHTGTGKLLPLLRGNGRKRHHRSQGI